MVAELYSSTLRYKKIDDEGETVINFGADGHGGGDAYIMKELYETMSEGVEPKCSGDEGLESAVVALILDQAAQTNQMVDLEQFGKNLEGSTQVVQKVRQHIRLSDFFYKTTLCYFIV